MYYQYSTPYYYQNELYHHGIHGQKWGVRRYQNADGSLTAAGKKRYGADTVEGISSAKGVSKRLTDVDSANTRNRYDLNADDYGGFRARNSVYLRKARETHKIDRLNTKLAKAEAKGRDRAVARINKNIDKHTKKLDAAKADEIKLSKRIKDGEEEVQRLLDLSGNKNYKIAMKANWESVDSYSDAFGNTYSISIKTTKFKIKEHTEKDARKADRAIHVSGPEHKQWAKDSKAWDKMYRNTNEGQDPDTQLKRDLTAVKAYMTTGRNNVRDTEVSAFGTYYEKERRDIEKSNARNDSKAAAISALNKKYSNVPTGNGTADMIKVREKFNSEEKRMVEKCNERYQRAKATGKVDNDWLESQDPDNPDHWEANYIVDEFYKEKKG